MPKKKLEKKFLQGIKQVLLDRKASLEDELSRFAKTNIHNKEDFETEFPNYGDKDDENSAEVATFSDNLSLERELETSLRDVKDALQRIEEGSYGYCKYCGELINIERLKARPVSSSCMTCKTKLTGG